MFKFLRGLNPFRKDPKLKWLNELEASLHRVQYSAQIGISKLTGPMPLDKRSRLDFFQETTRQIEKLLKFVEILKDNREGLAQELRYNLEQLCSYILEQTRDLPPVTKVPPPPGVDAPNLTMNIPIMHQGIIRDELKVLISLKDSFPYTS